jgi:cation transport regulator ChaB
MPRNELPIAARVLPPAGQRLWLRVFNEELDKGMSEPGASETAWAAVKRAGYAKGSDGKWSKSMDILKTSFELNDDGSFQLGVPLTKIDVKKREVSGFATLDNIDEAGDILESDASREAFGLWFGNIREMHQKKAVGKAVDWRPDTYVDSETGDTYEGIWVTAKVSKGAEDTWQKVLDGTLGGFSVGGATLEKERVLVKAGGEDRQAWKITKYRLTELSLVDNPCNRFATISLIKSVDGSPEVEDTIADGDIDKAYNGESGEFVDLSPELGAVVAALESYRDRAIEVNADYEVSRASELLAGVRCKKRCEEHDAEYEAKYSTSEESEVYKSADKEESMTDDLKDLEKSGETSQNNEVSDITSLELSEEDKGLFRKLLDFIKGDEVSGETETEPVQKNEEGTPEMEKEELTKAIDEKAEELTKSVDEKFAQVAESLTKVTELFEKVATAEAVEAIKSDIETKFEALESRIKAVEESGAVKKSGDDAGTTGEELKKDEGGFWSGSLLPEFALQKG